MTKIYLFREPLFLAIYVIGIGIALFASMDILDKNPWIRSISVPLSGIFPPIKFYIEKSNFPQVTELFFTFMWIVAPLHYYWYGKDLTASMKSPAAITPIEEMRLGDRIATSIAILLFLVSMPFMIYYYWFLNSGNEFAWIPVHDSRLALAFGGFLYAGALGWFVLRIEIAAIEKIGSLIKNFIRAER